MSTHDPIALAACATEDLRRVGVDLSPLDWIKSYASPMIEALLTGDPTAKLVADRATTALKATNALNRKLLTAITRFRVQIGWKRGDLTPKMTKHRWLCAMLVIPSMELAIAECAEELANQQSQGDAAANLAKASLLLERMRDAGGPPELVDQATALLEQLANLGQAVKAKKEPESTN